MPSPTTRSTIEIVLDQLFRELKRFPGAIQERGRRYFRSGRVGKLGFGAGRVEARVQGQESYRTSWAWSEKMWRPACSCPVAPYCKHSYALAEKLFEALLDPDKMPFELLDTFFRGLTPDAVAPIEPRRAMQQQVPARPERPAPPPAPPLPPPPPPPASLEEFLAARGRPNRARALDRLLRESGITSVDVSHEAFAALFDGAANEMLAFLVTKEVLLWTKGALPPELEAYRDRPELDERYRRAQLPRIELALNNWAVGHLSRGERQFRLVLKVRVSGRGDLAFWLEPRVTSARLRDEVRNEHQLGQLQTEARRNPGLLSTSQLRLLDAVLAMYELSRFRTYAFNVPETDRGALAEFLLAVMPSNDVVWDEVLAASLAHKWGVLPGAPVRFDPSSVRFVPQVERDGGHAVVRMSVRWADGRFRDLSEVAHICEVNRRGDNTLGLVVSDGVVYPVAETPPTRVVELLRFASPLRLDRSQGEPIVRTLSAASPSTSESAQAFTHQHPVEPAVLLRLDENDWLQVRVIGHTAGEAWIPGQPIQAPARLFEFTPDAEWEEAPTGQLEFDEDGVAGNAVSLAIAEGSPEIANGTTDDAMPAAAAEPLVTIDPAPVAPEAIVPPMVPIDEAWFHEPDPRRVERVLSWLRSMGVEPGLSLEHSRRTAIAADAHVGWWVRITPRTVGDLAEHWQRRPVGVRWFGNDLMQSLLGSHRTLRPAVSAKRYGVDLLMVSAEWKTEGARLSDADIEHLRMSKQPWVKLSSGWVQRDSLDIHDEISDLLADLGIEAGGGEQKLTLWQLAQARPESLEALEAMGADAEAIAAVRELRERVAQFKGLPRCKMPKGLNGKLRPYQQRGLDFLAHASSLGMGAVLADDMGLGKTIQALAWILHLRAQVAKPGPSLVVCPASVVHNWQREAALFAPELRVMALTSGGERRDRMREVAKHDVVLTNYALLRRDIEQWQELPLFAAILDEAQQIKNPHTAVSMAVRQLQATHRLALTGTPLENRALDLWSIAAFVNPGYLGSQADFTRRFDRANAPAHVRRLLSARLRPMLLRRLKKEVAPELPERIEEQRMCEMLPAQRKLYLVELQKAREEIAAMALREELSTHKIQILAILTRLRQLCCHPRLAGAKASVGSGKFDALFEMLEPLLAEGHKVLLFSQFVKALELVQVEFKKRRIPYHLLTGSTATAARPAVVRAFEDDPEACVFLISLRAGGTGLNLTAASYVVLLDPWWNPAVEAQAIDRTHRIGQHRTVIAYRLLMKGTIEERIWELQQRKSDLVNSVLGDDGFARKLDREALEYLFAEM